MSGYEQIREALAPLGIPVTAHIGDPQNAVYAVVHEMLERPDMWADNAERLVAYYAQIDFIAKTNIETTVREATRLLALSGFLRRDKRTEYEPTARVYRYVLRVRKVMDIVEEGMNNG